MTRRILVLTIALWGVGIGSAIAQQETVATHRKAYPERLTPEQTTALLEDVAADLNAGGNPDVYGLLKDVGGNHCGAYECDIICRTDGQHWDVLTDSTDTTKDKPENCATDAACEDGEADGMYFGLSGPAWQPKGLVDPTRCEVIAGDPTPPDPTEPPACDACDELAILRSALDSFSAQLQALDATVSALAIRVDALENKPPVPPPCVAGEVETSRNMWHTHRVRTCVPQ